MSSKSQPMVVCHNAKHPIRQFSDSRLGTSVYIGTSEDCHRTYQISIAVIQDKTEYGTIQRKWAAQIFQENCQMRKLQYLILKCSHKILKGKHWRNQKTDYYWEIMLRYGVRHLGIMRSVRRDYTVFRRFGPIPICTLSVDIDQGQSFNYNRHLSQVMTAIAVIRSLPTRYDTLMTRNCSMSHEE